MKHRRLKEDEEETSFDAELLPRSVSDGNLIRYNITIQDIKLANKIWTNEGLWPGRSLRIPIIETSNTNLDLSGSSGCTSDTMSTDSQVSAGLVPPLESSGSSAGSSRRVSSTQEYGFPPISTNTRSFNSSPISLPLQRSVQSLQGLRSSDRSISQPIDGFPSVIPHRASVEDLSSFLTAMDSSIEINKKASITLMKSSKFQADGRVEEVLSGGVGPVDFLTNNNGSIARGGRAQDHNNIC